MVGILEPVPKFYLPNSLNQSYKTSKNGIFQWEHIRENLRSKMGLIRKRFHHNFLLSWNSRTNRISRKSVNHNGWLDIFVKKNYFFSSYFQHISLWFYSNFEWEHFWMQSKFCIQWLPSAYFLWDPFLRRSILDPKSSLIIFCIENYLILEEDWIQYRFHL